MKVVKFLMPTKDYCVFGNDATIGIWSIIATLDDED
jgi:hypothetical protein